MRLNADRSSLCFAVVDRCSVGLADIGDLFARCRRSGCTSIFVGNLPYNVSQTAVADIFRPIGGRRNIVRVSVKQGKGFALVEFNLTVSPSSSAPHRVQ